MFKNFSEKKKIFLLALSFLVSFSLVMPVLALNPSSDTLLQKTGDTGGYDVAGTGETTISQYAGVYIKMALSLVGTIFLILTIYSGILWMTASGNDEQITKAVNILKAALIGFIIVTSAYSLTAFVLAGGSATTNAGTKSDKGCDLGGWERNTNIANNATHDAVCGAKGAVQGIAGAAGGFLDLFTFGNSNLGSKWSNW